MRKSRIIISLLLAASLTFSSCGKKPKEAPELLEPVSMNESYRTACYGDIGDFNIYYGVVTSKEHCQFYETASSIKDIKVKLGDHVSKGDILATADVESINERITELNDKIKYEDKLYSLTDKRYNTELSILESKRKAAETATSNDADANDIDKEIRELKENHDYELKKRKSDRSDLNEDIKKLKTLLADGNLVATDSGYVSFVKDISTSNYVQSYENVVVISDESEKYIAVMNATVDQELLKDARLVCTYFGGKRVDLSEYEYSPEAVLKADSNKQKLTLRMAVPEELSSLSSGDTLAIYVSKNSKDNILMVGNDSIIEDDIGSFVYVKSGNEKVARRVEIGEKDALNSEIISGINEGEQIYYNTEYAIPREYTTYSVSRTDYVQELSLDEKKYAVVSTNSDTYYSDYEGRVTDIKVAKNQEIKKGDLILRIDTNQGSAHFTEMKKNIESYKESHKKTVNDRNSKKNELTLKLSQLTEGTFDYISVKCELELLKLDIEIEAAEYSYQIKKLEKEYDKAMKNNDGKGIISIFAKSDGKVSVLSVTDGKYVSAGTLLAKVAKEGDRKLLIASSEYGSIVGAKVNIISKKYELVDTTTIYGISSNETNYTTERNGKIYITVSHNAGEGGFADLKEGDLMSSLKQYKLMLGIIDIKDVIVIPRDLVHIETDTTKVGDNKLYFVWKLKDDQVVKQYIRVAPTIVSDMKQYYVTYGLEEGDVIAGEAE